MRRLLALALTASVCLPLAGCSGVPEEAEDDARWTAALREAIEPLDHVDELVDVGYSLQGPFVKNKAWISGYVWSDSDDETVNLALLDDVGRAVATVMADNPIADSWVKISVVDASGDNLALSRLGLPASPDLDDLADQYAIPRRR